MPVDQVPELQNAQKYHSKYYPYHVVAARGSLHLRKRKLSHCLAPLINELLVTGEGYLKELSLLGR